MYHPHHHHKIKKKRGRRILQKKEELSEGTQKRGVICETIRTLLLSKANPDPPHYLGVDNKHSDEKLVQNCININNNSNNNSNNNNNCSEADIILTSRRSPPSNKLDHCKVFHNSINYDSSFSEMKKRCAHHTFLSRRCNNSSGQTLLKMKNSSAASNYWPNEIKSCFKKNVIALGIFLTVCFATIVQGQPPPLPPAGFIDFDNLPVTRFSCEGKVIGGYYADVETGCQMFHVCTLGNKDEVQDIKFLCLNGTVFDQETRVCERVDEVDCSKAEQYYDLNLDLYVPHVATPKPPEPDLEEEDDFIHPVSTHKPPSHTTSTVRTTTPTTTTTRPTTVKTTTTTRSRPQSAPLPSPSSSVKSSPSSNSNTKGFSSFNYYLKTPHSHVASGYNSQSQQSYIFNHNPASGEKEEGSYTVSESESEQQGSESTGRKIPSGSKTIVYAVSSSSTARPRAPSPTTTTVKSTTHNRVPKPEEYEEQYADEYYDDVDYDISSSTTGSQAQSEPKSYALPQQQSQRNSNNNNKHLYQPQGSSYSRGKVTHSNSYDYRDGRSTYNSKSGRGANSNNRESETKSHVSVAISSSSKSTRSPPTIVTPKGTSRPTPPRTRATTTRTTTTTTTRRPLPRTTPEPEPYYYEDDYPDDTELQQELQHEREQQEQPMIIVRTPSSSTTLRTVSSSLSPKNNLLLQPGPTSPTGDGGGTGPSGLSGDNIPEYYDEGDGTEPVNVNSHHFSHVDVPRIPFAKPNVPRVLVTNGKPFLPRLTRHIPHHHYSSKDILERRKGHFHHQDSYVSRRPVWDSFMEEDALRRKRSVSGSTKLHHHELRKSKYHAK